MKKIIIAVITVSIGAFLSCSSHSEIKQDNVKDTLIKVDVKKLSGKWMSDCDNGSGSIILMPNIDTAYFDVTSNQVQIVSKASSENGVIEFRLINPTDLGNGGMMLNWDDFSKDSLIAIMTPIDSDKVEITWYGFYDLKLKQRKWEDGFDILTNRQVNHTILNRCKDFHFL